MEYYVNEDIPDNAATVHTSECRYAQKRCKKPEDGKWCGPFADRESAWKCAEATGRRNVRFCSHCN